jgi:hypothetical protein
MSKAKLVIVTALITVLLFVIVYMYYQRIVAEACLEGIWNMGHDGLYMLIDNNKLYVFNLVPEQDNKVHVAIERNIKISKEYSLSLHTYFMAIESIDEGIKETEFLASPLYIEMSPINGIMTVSPSTQIDYSMLFVKDNQMTLQYFKNGI